MADHNPVGPLGVIDLLEPGDHPRGRRDGGDGNPAWVALRRAGVQGDDIGDRPAGDLLRHGHILRRKQSAVEGIGERWISALADSLNGGLLPPEYMAMTEQVTGRPIPDVVTLHARAPKGDPGGVAVATVPPTARVIARFEKINYAKRADRVVIRHGRGKVVAIVEIVSPG